MSKWIKFASYDLINYYSSSLKNLVEKFKPRRGKHFMQALSGQSPLKNRHTHLGTLTDSLEH
jgi:hypothetical protein